MIKIFLVLLLISSSAWSRVSLELVLDTPSVKQGEIALGRLVVKQTEGQAGLAGLKGKNLGKTIYLLYVSPFMGKQGQLEAEAKVIFLTVPDTTAISETVNGEEVFISWSNIEVIPTETSKTFLLGDFEIPEKKKILIWVLMITGLLLLLGTGLWLKQYLQNKKLSKNKLKALKQELTNCTSYEDIVLMWRQKQRYLEAFPQIDPNFKNFEAVLFKYQFKPQRTANEIDEVITNYQKFKHEVTGVLNEI